MFPRVQAAYGVAGWQVGQYSTIPPFRTHAMSCFCSQTLPSHTIPPCLAVCISGGHLSPHQLKPQPCVLAYLLVEPVVHLSSYMVAALTPA